jgi:hypothetical protein
LRKGLRSDSWLAATFFTDLALINGWTISRSPVPCVDHVWYPKKQPRISGSGNRSLQMNRYFGVHPSKKLLIIIHGLKVRVAWILLWRILQHFIQLSGSIIGDSVIFYCKSSLGKVLISTGCFVASPIESNPVFWRLCSEYFFCI